MTNEVGSNGTEGTAEQLAARYMTTEDICALYHVTRHSVYRWKREGYLHSSKVGGRNLYSVEEVEGLAEALTERNRRNRETYRANYAATLGRAWGACGQDARQEDASAGAKSVNCE